jgi:hypothetical protein
LVVRGTTPAEPLRLRRVPDPLAPCYVVGTAGRAATNEEAIRRIASSDFDPRAEVVVEMTYFPRAVGFGIGATTLGLLLVDLLLRPRP